MLVARTIVSVLIALAIAVAPFGAATAAARSVAAASHDALVGQAVPAPAIDMADCDKRMGGETSDPDCACCDPKGACPPQFCPLKTFKVFAGWLSRESIDRMSSSRFVRTPQPQPPDWITAPLPPPPKT